MIQELKEIITSEKFKHFLNNPEMWETLDVDYHPPYVERVWMPWNDGRLCLHKIEPCERDEALVHPHPWKSAMYVLPIGGKYEHGCGLRYYRGLMHEDMITSVQEFRGDAYYEMTHPDGIHYVRPIGLPVYSVMYSGRS